MESHEMLQSITLFSWFIDWTENELTLEHINRRADNEGTQNNNTENSDKETYESKWRRVIQQRYHSKLTICDAMFHCR